MSSLLTRPAFVCFSGRWRPFGSFALPASRSYVAALRLSRQSQMRSRSVFSLCCTRCHWTDLSNLPCVRQHSTAYRSPYVILGVSPSASEKEIKLAYYKLAKQYHPDMHREKPMDEQVAMKKKFQEISSAYEYLTSKKEEGFSWSGWESGAGQSQSQQYQYSNAEDVFASVMQDTEVLKEAAELMLADMREEFKMAIQAAYEGDFDHLWEIAKANKGVIFGVVVPTALVLRFPTATAAVLRGALVGAEALFIYLLQSGRTKELSLMLWKQIIRNSESQINYLKSKELKRNEKIAEYQRKYEQAADSRNHGHPNQQDRSASHDSQSSASNSGTGSGTQHNGASTSGSKDSAANSNRKKINFRWKKR